MSHFRGPFNKQDGKRAKTLLKSASQHLCHIPWSLPSQSMFKTGLILKTQSDKCLKSPVWENPLTSNMANVPKHCSNLHQSTFIIFIDQLQIKWVGKCLSYWHAKSWDCLLAHCLPMKSILFLIERI